MNEFQLTTLGGDPEVAVVAETEEHGTLLIPAYAFTRGSKQNPTEVGKFKIPMHPDNVSLEVGWQPATSMEQWNTVTYKAWEELYRKAEYARRRLDDYGKGYISMIKKVFDEPLTVDDLRRSYFTVDFRSAYDVSMFKEHPELLQFGCEPDQSAYHDGEVMKVEVEDHGVNPFRYGGGHIHFGIEPVPDLAWICTFVRWLDIWFTMKGVNGPSSEDRRLFYGQPGRFRTKPYGFEYRTPSNRWFLDRNIRPHVWAYAQEGFNHFVNHGEEIPGLDSVEQELAVEALVGDEQTYERRKRLLTGWWES